MRIGIFLGEAADIDRQVRQVVEAEEDGFDSVWFGQIFAADALTTIALAGKATKRIELGTAVIPTYPRHPFALAQQALTTQAAAGGRLLLGLGLSHKPVVENMWGLSYDKPARHMREYLSVLRPLLNEGQVSFQGDVFRVAGGVQVPGATPPSLLIAALAPLMLRMAGELTDGTVTWMCGPKTIETHIAPRINAAASDAGRPAPRVCVGLPVAVTEDVAGARARIGEMLTIYGQLENYRRVLDKERDAASPADVAIVGDEADVERQLRSLASAGATDLLASIFPVDGDADASVARTQALLKGLVGKV